ncbi:MAG: hypothetical protein JWN40_104 [Phycisphaerales bacterium]|nr:hypothetical protein [Phycisphaerales bacterium]
MTRLLRILTSVATVLSLVLCVTTAAAWVRSYRARDIVWWSRENPRLELRIGTYRGGLFGSVIREDSYLSAGTGWQHSAPVSYTEAGGSEGRFFNRFGFSLEYFHSRNSAVSMRELSCPYWSIMLLTAILPAVRFARWRRRARRVRMRPGLCRHCGYDCHATPDRCPECGRATGDEPSR